MIFIWSFVFINRGNAKSNRAFLLFSGAIILWMILNLTDDYISYSILGLILKSIYFITMLNLAVLFLNFVYRLIHKKYDVIFYIIVSLNTLAIMLRFLFPIDFTRPNFWQISNHIMAPIMATIFSLPMAYAIFLIIKYSKTTVDLQLKRQYKLMLIGITSASITSIISEYVFPNFFEITLQFSLMYISIFIFVLFIFLAIFRHRFLNIDAEYIYQKMFLKSNEGILLINDESKILSINNVAKSIFNEFDSGHNIKISEYIKSYDYNIDYSKHEIVVNNQGITRHLQLSQSPIDIGERGKAKLLHLIDITPEKLALSAERAKLIEKSSIDELTGLYNKRYLIENYFENMFNKKTNYTVMFIDIDDYKSINDNFGHAVGDDVLKCVSESIKESLRDGEIAVRYGGDEFVVIFENVSVNNAKQIAERIRKKVNTLDFAKSKDNVKLTLSIGLSEGIGDIDTLVKNADNAMYKSKAAGKNRVSIYSDDE